MLSIRKILGVHIREKMRNEDIRMALKKTENIVQKVHERQHQWLGHLLWIDKDRVAKTI